MATSKFRIGIDVGGTFTHAVALNSETLELAGKAKVPTTHSAPEGVAKGIVQSLQSLLAESKISPAQVVFIAHSTTQATNALLEGDVAAVGILGMAAEPNVWVAKTGTNLGNIELAPGKSLKTFHAFINTTKPPTDQAIKSALQKLIDQGAKAIAISEAFSVDQPDQELRALKIAQDMGLLATAGSEVSQLYGLKVRTRTAVINASMLPKMIESANMTETSVRNADITAPVMIMRSDGGVMDIEAMRKKPIHTMLSGPAAGVAAAMMFLHISDGIFVEVGGTSTDISAISNGRAKIRSGEIGGNKVYMHTLDVRTVGVAGGSIPRIRNGTISDVGPRSAHIASLKYASFAEQLKEPTVQLFKPLKDDPDNYLGISDGNSAPLLTITPTCSANLLGLVPAQDPAYGNLSNIETDFGALAKFTNKNSKELADAILKLSAAKLTPTVQALIKDHKLDASMVSLIGGGGGAAAIVPYLAKHLNMRYELAQHADVISAIGVALALIRETVERQYVHPTKDDILRLREQAYDAVQKMGADPSTVDVYIEVDARTNIVRATAQGAASLTKTKQTQSALSADERKTLAASSMKVQQQDVSVLAETNYFYVLGATRTESKLFGLIKGRQNPVRVIDSVGSIRLQNKNGIATSTTVAKAESTIKQIVEENAHWGDAGKIIPDILLLIGPKILDLSGLLDIDQVISVAKTELENHANDSQVIVLANLNF
jgi:N-methylhydantoinase A/oxoprolinase/acetone carboxylase beta subunit